MATRGLLLTAWDSYQRRVLPPDAPEVQRTEVRRGFYAGAASMFEAMNSVVSDDPNAIEADAARVGDVVREITEFLELVHKGLA